MNREFVGLIHKATERDYHARALPPATKARHAELALKWNFDYWDGSRSTGYGGYFYRPGYWLPVAQAMIETYQLKPGMKVLDVGCGKGHLLFELTQACPGLEVAGLDISAYAIEHAKREMQPFLKRGTAASLPWPGASFDAVISVTCLHNLLMPDLWSALQEIERVCKPNGHRYVCVEAYRTETEKINLMYWQLTCRQVHKPEEWEFIFEKAGYCGDRRDSEFLVF